MANTFVDLELLSTDKLKLGIAQTILFNSPLLPFMPFITIANNNYLYNLESVAGGADWYNVGDTWAESTPTWVQRTIALKVLGGDADVDSFMQQTRTTQDIKSAVIELKAKAIAYKYDLDSIMGSTTLQSDAKAMKGLLLHLAECETASTTDWDAPNNSQIIAADATSTVLTLAMLNELIDAVLVEPVHILLMSKRMQRKVDALARASGAVLRETHDDFGRRVLMYAGIPIVVSDRIPDNLPDADGSSITNISTYDQTTTRIGAKDNSVIFAIHFGEDGLMGVQNGMIQIEDIGKLETKDATRTRIKWYCNLINHNTKAIAGLVNVLDAAL